MSHPLVIANWKMNIPSGGISGWIQSEMMSNQMKPMAFTMIIAIPIIMWLRIFVNGMDLQVMSLPLLHW